MRLPKNNENWTPQHVDATYEDARKKFAKYEAKINFEWSRERQEACYRPYAHARQVAIEVARNVGCDVERAEALP